MEPQSSSISAVLSTSSLCPSLVDRFQRIVASPSCQPYAWSSIQSRSPMPYTLLYLSDISTAHPQCSMVSAHVLLFSVPAMMVWSSISELPWLPSSFGLPRALTVLHGKATIYLSWYDICNKNDKIRYFILQKYLICIPFWLCLTSLIRIHHPVV